MDARRYLRHNDSSRVDSGRISTGWMNGRSSGGVPPLGRGQRTHHRVVVQERVEPSISLKARMTAWWLYFWVALKWMMAGFVLVGLALLLPALWAWLDRPIAGVGVGGTIHYLSAKHLQERLRPYVQTTFFGLDLVAMQSELQRDPWINDVKVRRIWPDRVEVMLEEKVPVARWQDRDMISINGEILAGAPVDELGEQLSDFPSLRGVKGQEGEVMQQYLTLSHQLRPLGLKVTGVELSATGSWSFAVDQVRVLLGKRDLITRMQRFSRLYNSTLQARWADVKRVDLRYRDGVAVAWSGASVP